MLWWSKPLRVNQQIILYSRCVQDTNRTPFKHVPRMAHRSHTSTLELVEGAWNSMFGSYKEGRIGDKVGLLWAGMWDDGTTPTFLFSILLASVFGTT